MLNFNQDAVDYIYVSTPISHEFYLNAHQGAAYGLDHTHDRFNPIAVSILRPESGIKGYKFVIYCHNLHKSAVHFLFFISM